MRLFNRLKTRELSAFLNNLASLISSGVTTLDALETLSKICGKSVREVSVKLLDDIRGGENLSDAFAKQAALCGYANAVRAGEQSGKLPEILRQISVRLLRKNQTASKLKTAFYYPTFVLILALGAAVYMTQAIVPKFAEMLAETSGGGLPPLTVAVMGLSELISKHWLLLILFIVCSIVSLRWLIKNPFKMRFAAITLKLPLIGEIVRNSEFADFFDKLSFLLSAGLTASESLKNSADAVKNPYIRSELNAAYREMTDSGTSLAEALTDVHTMTEIERQCIVIAEKSGSMCEILQSLSGELITENEQITKRLTSLFEPALTVIVGAVVGVIMLAVYLPVVSIMQI